MSADSLPVIYVFDYIISESTVAGCAAAHALASAGYTVALVSSGVSPAREVAIGYHAWVDPMDKTSLSSELGGFIERSTIETFADNTVDILDLTAFTTCLEDWLLDAKVNIFYDQKPVGSLVTQDNEVKGVIVAGKAGIFAIAGQTIIDSSDTGVVAQTAAGTWPITNSTETEVKWVTYCEGLDDKINSFESSEEIRFKRFGPWLEWTVKMVAPKTTASYTGDLGLEIREKVRDAVKTIRENPDFAKMRIVRGADHVATNGYLNAKAKPLPAGLNLLHPQADIDSMRVHKRGLGKLWQAGLNLATSLTSSDRPNPKKKINLTELQAQTAPPDAWTTIPDTYFIGCHDRQCPVPELGQVPWQRKVCDTAQTQAIVTGGGTSGLPAAAEAAQSGIKVTLIEKYGNLGGTNTVGGVSAYWYGRKTEYVNKHDQKIRQYSHDRGLGNAFGKMEIALQAGVQVRLNSIAAGVCYKSRLIKGILVTSDFGLQLHEGKYLIDATGDADLAAWAGHPYEYGTGIDEATYWYSFGKFIDGQDEASREYHSIVDFRNPKDLTRCLIASRRRIGNRGYGDIPQFYLALRESRRILGRYNVSNKDIVYNRREYDTILVCESNFDIKGITADELILAGFVEPDFHRNFQCALPWRSLLPKNLDNLVIVGKAYSVTHDALSLARMQRDLIAMGGVAGTAISIAQNQSLSEIDIRHLQNKITQKGILDKCDLEQVEMPSIEHWLGLLRENKLPLEGQLQLIDHVDTVKRELKNISRASPDPSQTSLLAARILWQGTENGDREAGEIMLKALDQSLESKELPDLHAMVGRHEAPDHGWAPWPCYLIHALSQKREEKLISRLKQLVKRLPRKLDYCDKHYHYAYAVIRGAERLALPSLQPILQELLSLDWLQDNVMFDSDAPRQSVNQSQERFAYLSLCLARAGTACNLPEAKDILSAYTKDQRHWLARSAVNQPVIKVKQA